MIENAPERLNITLSNKTRLAMLSHLKKYGGGVQDISTFIEDAITWRIIDRQAAIREFLASEEGTTEQAQDDDLLTA